MNLQDYQVLKKKIAADFVAKRSKENPGDLLQKIKTDPASLHYQGFIVSMFQSFNTPEQCGWIVASSDSQDLDPGTWNNLSPREAIFEMAFSLLKNDVWNEIVELAEGKKGEILLQDNSEQLTMFGAA